MSGMGLCEVLNTPTGRNSGRDRIWGAIELEYGLGLPVVHQFCTLLFINIPCATHYYSTHKLTCMLPDACEPNRARQCIAVLCGLPAAGKTAFCTGIVRNFGARGCTVVHHCFDAVMWSMVDANCKPPLFEPHMWKVLFVHSRLWASPSLCTSKSILLRLRSGRWPETCMQNSWLTCCKVQAPRTVWFSSMTTITTGMAASGICEPKKAFHFSAPILPWGNRSMRAAYYRLARLHGSAYVQWHLPCTLVRLPCLFHVTH